ncbi:arsenosugar biosynthesis radical SAM protein ArsS [Simiduia sp. 21SJ11W-1]|uniref:arsenosugar biosynthesis radical SAM (seleno)protein ArsS n=1 Tax=Simiduia sp. 21SJ11W-1 TaxID=2909669 RepID=UPI00209E53C2|nr:arsenosugar biosynthesis radical SAM (seleno)protein ArsS [Simiduia sp. 21SJ11W-1]UTA49432.1 arsenosugar biosynthesis radical SAM protein ArsS [Simiduia sp. 21SJ11W-1]
MLDTKHLLTPTDFPAITRGRLHTLQVNLGYLCNLSCTHCHVNAGPRRTELMDRETIDMVIEFALARGVSCVDVTGGAPEMNPHFRYLVETLRGHGISLIDRCNLTILLEPGFEDMAQFLATHQVHVVASLPCYEAKNVAEQRGKGVYEQSVEALVQLNALGYGTGGALKLDLVYNPNGAFLPPPQAALQADYKRELGERHGIVFDELLTITNMPISRFGSVLQSKGNFDDYLQLLKNNYSQANLHNVMCKGLISIDWQGHVYDCDFNQMLEMPMINHAAETIATDNARLHLTTLLAQDIEGWPIVVAEHCYGCTAGQGSSCGGALE